MEETQDKNQDQESVQPVLIDGTLVEIQNQDLEIRKAKLHSLWTACRYITDHPGCSKSDLQKHLRVIYPHGQIGDFMWVTWLRMCGENSKDGQQFIGLLEKLDYLRYNSKSVKGMRRGMYILPRGKEFAAEAEPAHTWARPKTVPTLWLEDNCEIGMLLTSRGRKRSMYLYGMPQADGSTHSPGRIMPGEIVTLMTVEDQKNVINDHILRKYGRSYPTATITILHAGFGLCRVEPDCMKPLFNNKRKGGKHVNQ